MRHLLLSNTAQLAIGSGWRIGPSLDLNFADTKSLIDSVSGQSLIDFTRASSGTYVGSDGLIKTATTNLLLRSEEFDNASWVKLNNVTVTANATTAPNGFITADKIVEPASSTDKPIVQSVTLIASTTYAASVYFQAAERPTILFHVRKSDYSTRFGGFFNTSTNVFTAETSGGGVLNSFTFTNVGGGWYRCSITGNIGANTAGIVTIYLANSSNNLTYTGDGTSGIYLWGAQLEQSATVGEYIPTGATINSAPRFDHDPTTGESLGLLVEEQRANLFPSSIYTANANGWTNGIIGGTGTIASASVTNKAGNTNGVFNVSGLDGSSYVGAFASTISSTNTYTASIFIKNNGGTVFQMRLVSQNGGTFKSSGTQYTFATGMWEDGLAGTTAPISRSVQDMGDGWLRFSITAADNGTGNTQTALLLFGSATPTNYNYYFWGAQLEAGAFPTSYIPTTDSTVTRAADVASITGSAFSSWYRADEGTVFASGDFANAGAASFSRVVSLTGENTGTDEISLYTRISIGAGDGTIYGAVTVDSSLQGDLNSPIGSPILSGGYRSAIAYKANDFGLSSNGLTPTTDASGTLPTITQLIIMGNVRFQDKLSGHIRRLTYWPARLSNEILQSITQQ